MNVLLQGCVFLSMCILPAASAVSNETPTTGEAAPTTGDNSVADDFTTPTAAAAAKAAPESTTDTVAGHEHEDTSTAVPTTSSQEWTLRYKFQPDQKLRYQTSQKMTLEASLGPNRRVDISEYRQRRVFSVLSVESSGAAQIAMQFEHVWMKKQIDDQEPQVFDSGMQPAEVPETFRQVAHQLKGSAPKYWLSTLGRSLHAASAETKSQNDDAGVRTAAVSAAEDDASDQADDKVQLAVGESTAANDREKDEVDPGSFLMLFPEQALKIGDTWKETIRVPVRVTTEINRTVDILRSFRLDSVEDGVATVSFRSSIESRVTGPTIRSQLIQATPRGSFRFDIDRGVLLSRDMTYNSSVVGAFGPESLLTCVGTNTEELLETAASTGE